MLSRATHAHAHLITLLATYEQGGKYHLVFPWAEANLLEYWKDINPTPPQTRKMATWLGEQCRGVADGLSTVHRYGTLSGRSLLHRNSFPLDTSKEPGTGTKEMDVNETTVIRLFGRHG